MKKLIIILFLAPTIIAAQKYEKKAEKEIDEFTTNYIKENGASWVEIQKYFEEYLTSNKIQYVVESTEQGYLNYIRKRCKKVVLPPLSKRVEFKELLKRTKVIRKPDLFIGAPLLEVLDRAQEKYASQLQKSSPLLGVIKLFNSIEVSKDVNTVLIAEGLNKALNKEVLKKPVFKKIVILSLFIDAVYQDEMFCRQVSEENPYKNKLEFRGVEKLEVGDRFPKEKKIQEPLNKTSVNNSPVEKKIITTPVDTKSVSKNIDDIIAAGGKLPEFPGGDIGLRKFIAYNVKYPDEARRKGIEGKVYVRFCVTSEGYVVKVSIAKSVTPVLDNEALRVVKSLPRWKPGEMNGEKVSVWYTVPIGFSLGG